MFRCRCRRRRGAVGQGGAVRCSSKIAARDKRRTACSSRCSQVRVTIGMVVPSEGDTSTVRQENLFCQGPCSLACRCTLCCRVSQKQPGPFGKRSRVGGRLDQRCELPSSLTKWGWFEVDCAIEHVSFFASTAVATVRAFGGRAPAFLRLACASELFFYPSCPLILAESETLGASRSPW